MNETKDQTETSSAAGAPTSRAGQADERGTGQRGNLQGYADPAGPPWAGIGPGRIVQVTLDQAIAGVRIAPAMVTHNHGGGRVDVTAFPRMGSPLPMGSLGFGTDADQTNTWRWPPRL